MASPQAENGHIDIANELAEKFYDLQLSGNSWRVLWVIIRQTWGWHRKEDRISFTFFEKKTGLKRRHIARALRDLIQRKIVTKNDTNFITAYGFQKDYEVWDFEPLPKMTLPKNGNESLPKMTLKLLPKMTPTKSIKETIEKKGRGDDPQFENFYKTYPKHEGRKKAFDAWKKLNPQNGQIETILTAIERQKRYKDHLRAKGQFCPEWPMPAAWINQERWTDEVPEVKPTW